MKATLAARETIPVGLLSRLWLGRHPARERNDNSPAGPAGRGGRPVQNRLGNVAQDQPAILFSIHRRVAKLSDGAVLTSRRFDPSAGAVLVEGPGRPAETSSANSLGHLAELRPHPRSVQGSEFQMRNRQLLSAQLLAEARAWADELTKMEIEGPFDLEDAWRRLEARYGIPVATFWSLRYRKDLKDIWASLHQMLQLAVEQERSRKARRASHQDFITKVVGSG